MIGYQFKLNFTSTFAILRCKGILDGMRDESNVHLVGSDKVCVPMENYGFMDKALLGKLFWRFGVEKTRL